MKRLLCLAAAIVFLSASGFAQVAPEVATPPVPGPPAGEQPVPVKESMADAASRLLLAASTEEYPVTPGDIYRLTYLQAGETITADIVVQSDYNLNLGLFGSLEGRGMTFSALRDAVQRKVTSAYPRSTPLLTIASLGLFQVLVRGEVPQSRAVTAWGLSRLTDVIAANLGPYSSVRAVRVVSSGGEFKVYDLYQALRFGDLKQNPYIRPGDVIEVVRRGREVRLAGEVLRPGSYQLLDNEGLRDLLDRYGGGFTRLAETNRIRIERVDTEQALTFYVDLRQEYRQVPLRDGDVVTVWSKTANLPIAFFEGAVLPGPAGAEEQPAPAGDQPAAGQPPFDPTQYNRLIHTFWLGETLSDALAQKFPLISPFADLTRVIVVREGVAEPIRVDLQQLRQSESRQEDFELAPNDRIIIPARQFYVSVSGEVTRPGIYPYVPNRTHPYYLNLAGATNLEGDGTNVLITDIDGNMRPAGEPVQPEDRIYTAPSSVSVFGAVLDPGQYPFAPGKQYMYYLKLAGGVNPAQNIGDTVRVLDAAGNIHKKDYVLRPGDRVYVPNNRFVDNFNRYFPIITSSITFATAIITLLNLVGP
jgi:protein involved in polysaccharide export with SLBB domain